LVALKFNIKLIHLFLFSKF